MGCEARRGVGPAAMTYTPRYISPEMAAQGFNNAGRGTLLGYISDPAHHEKSCAHKQLDDKICCTCRTGLWRVYKKPEPNMLAMG